MGMSEEVRTSGTSGERLSDSKTLPVEDVLDILRLILRVEPLDVLLQKVVDTISDAFGIKLVSLGVYDEKMGMFCPRALHGYPPDREVLIKKHAYTLERMKLDLSPEFKIGRSCYYVRAEDQVNACDDYADYIMHSDLVDVDRETSSDWHELDFIDFVMTDRIGNWIGWIEIDEPIDRKVPSKEVIDRIQMLSDLAAIAIENSRTYEETIDAMMDSQAYLDLIIHDIGNMVSPLSYYLGTMKEANTLNRKDVEYLDNSLAVSHAMKNLVDNVRKFSELKASESPFRERYVLGNVLNECCEAVRRQFPEKNVLVNLDCPLTVCPILADELIYDLFSNLLNNAVKYSVGDSAEIDVRLVEGYSAYSVRIEDRGRGIPDSNKERIFARFAKRPDGVTGTGLGLSIVTLLVERYNGIITVKDRVPGDYSQGACFEVSFPKVTSPSYGFKSTQDAISGNASIDGPSADIRKA
jgi:signal transduction histidine kinase